MPALVQIVPNTLAAVPAILQGILLVVFLIISVLMILIVLVQKPQGGGLSGAFGAASDSGAGQTAFGARTGDALTTVTVLVFLLFLISAVTLNLLQKPASVPTQPTANQQDADTETGGAGAGSDPATDLPGMTTAPDDAPPADDESAPPPMPPGSLTGTVDPDNRATDRDDAGGNE